MQEIKLLLLTKWQCSTKIPSKINEVASLNVIATVCGAFNMPIAFVDAFKACDCEVFTLNY